MARQKKDIIWPTLKNSNGDINKPWYIEFSVTDPQTGEKIRKRISDGFSQINTYEGRIHHAELLIKEYTKRIKEGEFSSDNLVEYDDLLLFDSQRRYCSKRRGMSNSLRVLASEFVQYKSEEVSAKTLQSYASKLRLFSDFMRLSGLDEKHISLINNKKVVEFLKSATKTKSLSKGTVQNYQELLYSFFKWIVEDKKILMENPVLNIPRMGEIKDLSAPALTEKIRNILQRKIELADPQLWLACCFQYYCAIRPGTELRLMRLKQINYEARTVTVRNYLAKNTRTETVDIPEQLFNLIREWDLENYDQNLYVFGKDGKPGDTPLGKNVLRVRFNKFRDELGLSKDIKFYSWKHSGAQELKIAGANIYSIQQHLRHKSLTTTEKYFKKRYGTGDPKIRDSFPDI